MRVKFVIIVICAFLLHAACGDPPDDTQSRGGEEQKPTADGELFLYRWGTGDIGRMGMSSPGEVQLIIADVATGETIGVHDVELGKQFVFSPDYSKILTIEDALEYPGMKVRLSDRGSEKESWSRDLPPAEL